MQLLMSCSEQIGVVWFIYGMVYLSKVRYGISSKKITLMAWHRLINIFTRHGLS